MNCSAIVIAWYANVWFVIRDSWKSTLSKFMSWVMVTSLSDFLSFQIFIMKTRGLDGSPIYIVIFKNVLLSCFNHGNIYVSELFQVSVCINRHSMHKCSDNTDCFDRIFFVGSWEINWRNIWCWELKTNKLQCKTSFEKLGFKTPLHTRRWSLLTTLQNKKINKF